jgi:uncharacterized protein YeaC (DUF1315 family)
MTLPRFLTEEELEMNNALDDRILMLYREKTRLDKEKMDIDKRIEHLEKQKHKLGTKYLINKDETTDN